jgi:hypothetical protein
VCGGQYCAALNHLSLWILPSVPQTGQGEQVATVHLETIRLFRFAVFPPLVGITNQPGKYATLSGKGDLLVAPKAQAGEFPASEAPRRQKELERRGFTTKVEPV